MCLQSCLTAIFDWSEHWQMKLSPSKCSVMHMKTKAGCPINNQFVYHIGQTIYFQLLIVLLAIDLSFRHMSTTSQPKPHCVLSWYLRPIRSTRTSVRDVRTGAFLTPVRRARGYNGSHDPEMPLWMVVCRPYGLLCSTTFDVYVHPFRRYERRCKIYILGGLGKLLVTRGY